MELNSFIFPAPPPTYTQQDFQQQLFWVPNINRTNAIAIPCLLIQSQQGSSKLVLYFHGNAQDLGASFQIMDMMRTFLKVHVLAMQYPGYGVYAGKPSAKQIIQDAFCVYDFVVNTLMVPQKNIIVFGRSIGSGPSTCIARYRQPGMLLLMSAYTSIKDVAKDVAGRFLKSFVADRFRNLDNIKEVYCPTFLIHGVLDNLIPYSHSQELHMNCKGVCHLVLPPDMDHNFFEYYEDFLLPVATFLTQCGIPVHPLEGENEFIKIPNGFLVPPPGQPKSTHKGKIHGFLSRFNRS